jgi:hypothetical protein
MDANTIVDALRAAGLYPAAEGERIHVYGDTATMPPALRDALRAERAAVLDVLRHPAQSVAYDVIDAASEAGWHPTVAGDRLAWHHPEHGTMLVPLIAPALTAAHERHRADIVRVLVDVPAGCRDRATCDAAGICRAEIWESACYRACTPAEGRDAA